MSDDPDDICRADVDQKPELPDLPDEITMQDLNVILNSNEGAALQQFLDIGSKVVACGEVLVRCGLTTEQELEDLTAVAYDLLKERTLRDSQEALAQAREALSAAAADAALEEEYMPKMSPYEPERPEDSDAEDV